MDRSQLLGAAQGATAPSGGGGGGSVAGSLRSTSQAGTAAGGPQQQQQPSGPQTTHALQQAALRRQVHKDINKMLHGTNTYRHKVFGAPVLSADSLESLAKPKVAGAHPDIAIGISDPLDWARWKTDQLVISRMTAERRAAEEEAENKKKAERLAEFMAKKAQDKAAKAEAKAKKAAEDALFGKAMSSYLNHKGGLELEDWKRRKEEERERVALSKSRLDSKPPLTK